MANSVYILVKDLIEIMSCTKIITGSFYDNYRSALFFCHLSQA